MTSQHNAKRRVDIETVIVIVLIVVFLAGAAASYHL